MEGMIIMNENKEYEKDERKPYEILNEQKENLLNTIKEKPEILDTQLLEPELIYPNMERYKVSNATNNLMLSIVAADKRYADNTWVLSDTVNNAKYKDESGAEKQVFFLKKGEKAIKIGIEVKERDVQDPITGAYYKEKLEKPYIKNVNVYNVSQFKFAKDIYPKKTFIENKKKDSITLSPEKIESFNKNTFEARLEKFFIEQKYNIKNKEEIKEINKEEFVKAIEGTRTKEGNPHKDSYRMELFPGIAMANSKNTIKESTIEKNVNLEKNKDEKKTEKKKPKKKEKELDR